VRLRGLRLPLRDRSGESPAPAYDGSWGVCPPLREFERRYPPAWLDRGLHRTSPLWVVTSLRGFRAASYPYHLECGDDDTREIIEGGTPWHVCSAHELEV